MSWPVRHALVYCRCALGRSARMALASILLASPFGVRSQADFSGEWTAVRSEANADEPLIGNHAGLPINREALRRAESWDPEIESLAVWQCRPLSGMSMRLDSSRLRIWGQTDPTSGEQAALWVGLPRSISFPIYLDGRAHPPEHAGHTWGGYSTGVQRGDALAVRTTHLKEGYFRRNGVPQSDRVQLTELLLRRTFRDRDYLTWVVVAEDPVYLTEPLVRSGTFRRAAVREPAADPCATVKPASGTAESVPHILPGNNEALNSFSNSYDLPPRIAADGAATMYPEYRAVIAQWRNNTRAALD